MITLLCNISDNKLRITLLCSEKIWRNQYICNIERQEKLSAYHDVDSKMIIRQYI